VGPFTPKRVAQLNDEITAKAAEIVDEFVERGGGDVVEDLSMKLPLWTISNMMGCRVHAADLYHAAQSRWLPRIRKWRGAALTRDGCIEAGLTNAPHR